MNRSETRVADAGFEGGMGGGGGQPGKGKGGVQPVSHFPLQIVAPPVGRI